MSRIVGYAAVPVDCASAAAAAVVEMPEVGGTDVGTPAGRRRAGRRAARSSRAARRVNAIERRPTGYTRRARPTPPLPDRPTTAAPTITAIDGCNVGVVSPRHDTRRRRRRRHSTQCPPHAASGMPNQTGGHGIAPSPDL